MHKDLLGIPFEAMPVLGEREKAPRPQAPSNLVVALPDRADLRIEFPRVDGFTVYVQRHLRCDVGSLRRWPSARGSNQPRSSSAPSQG